MNEQQAKLHEFFSEKSKHLQSEIELEIAKIGGEDMLISREDLIHWVYHAREQVETYHTICRMLEDRSEDADAGRILQELRKTVESDSTEIGMIRQKQEEEQKALQQLREEVAYYNQALEMLGR